MCLVILLFNVTSFIITYRGGGLIIQANMSKSHSQPHPNYSHHLKSEEIKIPPLQTTLS